MMCLVWAGFFVFLATFGAETGASELHTYACLVVANVWLAAAALIARLSE